MTETTKNMSGGVNSTQSAKTSVQSEIAAFLKASVEQSNIAQARADLRQKWIKKIVHLSGKSSLRNRKLTYRGSERSALNLKPTLDLLMKTIGMDAEVNGSKPQITCYLGVLDSLEDHSLVVKFLSWSQNQDPVEPFS